MIQAKQEKSRASEAATSGVEPPPLVEAKLLAPSLRRALVDRQRVTRALDGERHGSLALVVAPAGYGKTTAVRAWCASADAAMAWVTLEEGDNDPAQLWRYVATAVDRVREGLGRSALQRLDNVAASVEEAVDELLNGAAALRRPLVIVLDDLQVVTSDSSLRSLERAIAHLPTNVRLILISRIDPDLSLGRARVSGSLVELRAAQLAFTSEEVRELLITRERLDVGQEEVDILLERTEGWPAAVVLAGLWLKGVHDPIEAVREFHGDHRFVADYLSSEILAALDGARRTFFLTAAVLGRFTTDLCDAVLDRDDSADMLAELEQENLMVQGLERGGWYRVHSLLTEFARAQLAIEDPGRAAAIDRHAARWLRDRGLIFDAIAHGTSAGDHGLVADLLLEHHLPMIRSGGGRTFLHWVGTLPDKVIVGRPDLAAAAALASTVVDGSVLEQRRYLQLMDEAGGVDAAKGPLAQIEVLLSHTIAIDHGVPKALQEGREAVRLALAGIEEASSGALAGYARVLYFAGRLPEAAAMAARMLADPRGRRRTPSLVHSLATMALVEVEQGRIASAREHARQAKAAAGSIRTNRSWLGGNACLAVGVTLAAEGKYAEAEHELARAERLFSGELPTIHHTLVLVLLARMQIARGHLDGAQAILSEAEEALELLPDSGRVGEIAQDVQGELEAAQGRARIVDVAEPLSGAEQGVLELLTTDLSAREIGERLFLSPNTIRTHRRSIYGKLGVHTRSDAIARATALGLFEQGCSPR